MVCNALRLVQANALVWIAKTLADLPVLNEWVGDYALINDPHGIVIPKPV